MFDFPASLMNVRKQEFFGKNLENVEYVSTFITLQTKLFQVM